MKKVDLPKIKQKEVYELLPKNEEFKKTKYYQYSEIESNNIDANICDPKSFRERELERMKDCEYAESMHYKYSQLSKKGNKAYKIYNKIFNSVDKCVYCNIESHKVSELDHFFPKALFPALSISVGNLLPSCTYCNKPKNAKFPLEDGTILLNPYYDNCFDDIYKVLKYRINIVKGKLIEGEYYFDNSCNLDNNQFSRIKNHFLFFNLDDFYGTDFIQNYENFYNTLIPISNILNKEMIQLTINRHIEENDVNKNNKPWLYAGFHALLNCEEFYQAILYNG